MEEKIDFLGEVTKAISEDLGRFISVNIYACDTSRPLYSAHWDDHHIVVLQLSGAKSWTLLESNGNERPDPLNVVSEEGRKILAQHLLQSGEYFFLPARTIHKVEASGPSIHLSFGFSE